MRVLMLVELCDRNETAAVGSSSAADCAVHISSGGRQEGLRLSTDSAIAVK